MRPLLHMYIEYFGLGHIRHMSYLGGGGMVSHLDISGGKDTLVLARCITGLGREGGVVGHWESEGEWSHLGEPVW